MPPASMLSLPSRCTATTMANSWGSVWFPLLSPKLELLKDPVKVNHCTYLLQSCDRSRCQIIVIFFRRSISFIAAGALINVNPPL